MDSEKNFITIRLLGAMAAQAEDGQVIHFRTDKIRALLVYLLLEGERPHQRQSLATLLWPEMTDSLALKNLRQSLHRLQQALAAHAPTLSDSLLTITRQTVQCHRPPQLKVDVHTFEELLSASEAHQHRLLHLCHDCLERLAQAVALYQGELLEGFGLSDGTGFDEWLLFWRERLQHRVIDALSNLTEAHGQRGETEAAFHYAARLVQLDPFREEVHRQLMRLYVQRGEHTKALAQYERCRRLLHEELGVEPAPDTTALYRQIEAEQRGESTVAEATKPSPLYHFPMQFTPFVGREQELQQIEELFLDPTCRLLTLVGPGGIGKTRLSQRAAEQLAGKGLFPDGVTFVPLATVQTKDSLLTAILNGLGVTLDARREAREELFNFLRGRQSLLVLDNFEQLVDGPTQPDGATLLAELLDAAPGVRLLVSSHVALQLRAERRLVVTGLDYPDADAPPATAALYAAVRLFVESARQADPAFELTSENAGSVLEICRMVQGAPLALELAAAWTRVMDCQAIVREISRNLDFLSLSARDRPDRHQSLAAVFAYSWQLLTPPEQTVLARLAHFRGSFSLEAAAKIANATPLLIARLLDKSLLQRRRDGRYAFHELLRFFAARQATAEEEQTAQRHCNYYLTLVTAQEKAFYGPQPRQAIAATQPDLANIRQAWQWAAKQQQHTAIAHSAEAIGRLFQTAALVQEGEELFAQAIEQVGPSPHLLVWRAFFLSKLGRQADAIRLAEQALASPEHDDAAHDDAARAAVAQAAVAQADAHSLLGELLSRKGQMEAAITHQQQALAFFRATSDLGRLARALRRMVLAHWRSGDHDAALRYFRQALPVHQAVGEKRGLAQLHNLLAGIYYERGDLEQALTNVQEAQKLYEAIGDKLDAAVVAANLARLYGDMGRFEAALASNQRAIAISEELGDRPGLARDLSNRGHLLATMGDFDHSLRFYYRALDIATALRDQARIADFQAGLAAVYAARGDEETALTYYELALPALLAQGVPYHLAGPLLGKAELLYNRGDWQSASALVQQVRALSQEAGLEHYLRQAQIWEAKLAFAAGDKTTALAQLTNLLAQTEEVSEQAALHYELWQLTGDKTAAQAAATAYHQAYENHPTFTHKKRLQQLQQTLTPTPHSPISNL